MTHLRTPALVALLLAGGALRAPGPASAQPAPSPGAADLLPQARRLADRPGGALRRVGLAEMLRSAGRGAEALTELGLAARAKPAPPRVAECRELLCWRLMPVTRAKLGEFRRAVADLEACSPHSGWLVVYRLYLAALEQDRPAILRAAESKRVPRAFPTALAERAHLRLLLEVGLPRTRAGMEVITHRCYDQLYALRDLDRALGREVHFLYHARRDADAKRLEATRNRLRAAYRAAAKHLVERLFALKLSEMTQQRDELLARAKKLTYLTDPEALAKLLKDLGENESWSRIVRPLLSGELALIERPPDLEPAALETTMSVTADRKSLSRGTAQYEGSVEIDLAHLRVTCDRVSVVGETSDAPATLAGAGSVTIVGVPGFARITAERFTFSSDVGGFALGGNVRLHRARGTTKLRACTVTNAGVVRDARSLLDDFAAAGGVRAKLALLPRIDKVYADEELPDGVRYLLALNLLRKHLSWHVPSWKDPHKDKFVAYVRGLQASAGVSRRIRHLPEDDRWRWQDAHPGEPWMLKLLGGEAKASLDRARQAVREAVGLGPSDPVPAYWRIAHPWHPDVDRAGTLLERINQGELCSKATRWSAEIRRNNTVLTFDLTGGYPSKRTARVVMDLRNADEVTFRLYRARKAEELLWVTDRIGRDFIFRDHEPGAGKLAAGQPGQRGQPGMPAQPGLKRLMDVQRIEVARTRRKAPELKPEDLVRKWRCRVGDLKAIRLDRRVGLAAGLDDDRAWEDDEDGEYFDDACERHADRLGQRYWRWGAASGAWACGRVVEVPGEALAKAGGYILLAEANGQKAFAPILVDPLSLTLRRCRDGVFALVSSPAGDKPVEGAALHARHMLGRAITDTNGAAFVRVFAAGDRAILAEKDGRFAIGGFGRVYDGIYISQRELEERRWRHGVRAVRLRRQRASDTAAMQVYADRHVVAAYTDRPTYRPGQRAGLKLIVRRLQAEDAADAGPPRPSEFRAADFDLRSALELPPEGTEVRYTVLNPRRRAVASGTLSLNDYGTAAGEIEISPEAATGSYALRVEVGGRRRVVPGVFAVKWYRRPNFTLTVGGVPERLPAPRTLKLSFAGRYYFGKPLTGGKVAARLVRPAEWISLAEGSARLGTDGTGKCELKMSPGLPAGEYAVHCTLSDDSGRAVTRTLPCRIGLTGEGGAGLASLPAFVRARQPFEVPTGAAEVTAVRAANGSKAVFAADRQRRSATVKLPGPGWYRLSDGAVSADVFAYGGTRSPSRTWQDERKTLRPAKDAAPGPSRGWIDLTRYVGEHNPMPENALDLARRSLPDRPPERLLALPATHDAKVGRALRVLVYIPRDRARILLTIEGRTVVDYHLLTATDGRAKRGYHVVEVPIKRRHVPNFYLRGRVLWAGGPAGPRGALFTTARQLRAQVETDEEGEDPRWCRVDVTDPNAHPAGERLKVAVQTDRQQYAPGEPVAVVLRVTDLTGKPRPAELSLAAVDESVFSFGGDGAANLAAAFSSPHPPRRYLPKAWRSYRAEKWSAQAMARVAQKAAAKDLAQAVHSFRTASLAMSRAAQQFAPGLMLPAKLGDARRRLAPPPLSSFGEMPLSAMPLARVRADFRETAAWLPQLRAGADGVVRTRFTLPDSLTAWRLTAVGLTKDTEVGTARATVRTTTPLSVQLFLPRFAVETDRLLAVALIHNAAAGDRVCEAVWELGGAKLEGPAGDPRPWQGARDGKKTVLRGRVTVPAKGTTRAGLWIKLHQPGSAEITFQAAAGEDGDAERRSLPVRPLGRARTVTMTGTFSGAEQVVLPVGFTAREVAVTLSRGNVAAAMDGLGHLVGYPYGCVEQTMSRFLPAVMVRHAVRTAAVALPPEVERKLPAVLARGLERLYNYQHQDGGWGWWEKDATDNNMTVYVGYGLARCRLAGQRVDDDALGRVCAYLKKQLATGGLSRAAGGLTHGSRSLAPGDLDARAWLVLALAGQAEKEALGEYARRAMDGKLSPDARCNLALACQNAGLNEPAERLFEPARQWSPDTTDQIALDLGTQLAFGAPLAECRLSAAKLLARRRGHAWENTRATSWAIEALAGMLAYDRSEAPARRVTVHVAGKKVLDVTGRKELNKLVYRVRLAGADLPRTDAAAIDMSVDAAEPANFAVTAQGTQRLDEIQPIGTAVRMFRRYTTVDGKEIAGPLTAGQTIAAHVTVELTQPQRYFIIEDPRPAGCEFAEERIFGPAAASAAHVEFRDDRVCVFHAALPAGRHEVVYYLRAETPGVSHVLPGRAYPMYDDKKRGETGGHTLEIRPE